MFQKVPETTPNMRGFAPFWFRQIWGHNLHYNTQDVWFSASFEEISKQLPILRAIHENYPQQPPPHWGWKNSMVQKPNKSIENDPKTPSLKRFRRSTKNYTLAIPKVGGKKIDGH